MGLERDDYEDAEPRRGAPALRTLAVVGLCIALCAVILLWPLLWLLWALPGPLGPD